MKLRSRILVWEYKHKLHIRFDGEKINESWLAYYWTFMKKTLKNRYWIKDNTCMCTNYFMKQVLCFGQTTGTFITSFWSYLSLYTELLSVFTVVLNNVGAFSRIYLHLDNEYTSIKSRSSTLLKFRYIARGRG